jgi:NAD(P)-dependent dehydrogenase (short-subunit alcohol dehydrogenase family)
MEPQKHNDEKKNSPRQHQDPRPGSERAMTPEPQFLPFYRGVDKFRGQVVLVSGCDSGIGPAVSLAFANEGAHVAIIYLPAEDDDAIATKQLDRIRSLAQNLIDKGIRVNALAPGPIWTPLIPASFGPDEVAEFGTQAPMKRAGRPKEVAGCFTWPAVR